MVSQALLLALQRSVLVPFEKLMFMVTSEAKDAMGVLKQFNLQVVALLKSAGEGKMVEHVKVSLGDGRGADVVAYAFVRDIDFHQGIELILPYG